jgi:peptide deformylase
MSVREIATVGHPVDGILFLDRVRDPRTFTTWEQFDRHHRDEFVARISEFVERVGS